MHPCSVSLPLEQPTDHSETALPPYLRTSVARILPHAPLLPRLATQTSKREQNPREAADTENSNNHAPSTKVCETIGSSSTSSHHLFSSPRSPFSTLGISYASLPLSLHRLHQAYPPIDFIPFSFIPSFRLAPWTSARRLAMPTPQRRTSHHLPRPKRQNEPLDISISSACQRSKKC